MIIFLTIDNLLLPPLPSIKTTSINIIYPAHYNREPLTFEMRVTNEMRLSIPLSIIRMQTEKLLNGIEGSTCTYTMYAYCLRPIEGGHYLWYP